MSIGIHWNLTQGRPILLGSRLPTLVDSNGSFFSPEQLRRRWRLRQVNENEIRAELKAQFDRLMDIAGPLDFWNTHQNSHVYPGLFQAFVNLGRELRIPAMRCHRRITIPRSTSELSYNLAHPQYWLKGQVIAWWSARAESRGTLMPDARVYTPGYIEPEGMISEVISRLPWSKVKNLVEVIIHPATAIDTDLFGSITESRLLEYRAFKNPALAQDLRRKGMELVGFEALRLHSVNS